MKKVKHLILLSLFSFFGLASAHADGREEPIAFERLPKNAQEFLTTHFKDLTLAYIVADFRADGSWESVERKYAPVPAAIVPKQITDFVAKNRLFNGQFIREIERNPYTWEIKLSGGLEITFDAQFNVIGYDD